MKSISIKPKYHCSFGNQQTYSAGHHLTAPSVSTTTWCMGKSLKDKFQKSAVNHVRVHAHWILLPDQLHTLISVCTFTNPTQDSLPLPFPGQNYLQIIFLPLILPCRNSQALSVDNDPWTNQSHVSFLSILRPKNAFCIFKWVKRSRKECAVVMHTNYNTRHLWLSPHVSQAPTPLSTAALSRPGSNPPSAGVYLLNRFILYCSERAKPSLYFKNNFSPGYCE